MNDLAQDLQALLSEGMGHHKAGRLNEAEAAYRRILAAAPRHADTLHLVGMIELQRGHHEEAVRVIGHAIALAESKPAADFHSNIAAAYRALGRLGNAVEHYRQAAALKPLDGIAQFRLGLARVENGELLQAVDSFRQTAVLKPDFAEAFNNLGAVLKQLGKNEEACAAFRKALALQPRDATTHHNLGVVLKDMKNLDEALVCFAAATALDANHAGAHWNTALVHLLRGDFAAGWKTFDWYRKVKGTGPRAFLQPAWSGGDLHGKTLLIHEEHGYGDTLQFIRYARPLKDKGARVIVLSRPELAGLLRTVPGVDEVFSNAAALPPFDCHASVFNLPKLMNTDLNTIPASIPYFSAAADVVDSWRRRGVLKAGLNVGLVWRTDPRRAIGLAQLLQICAVPGINWLSLQVGADQAERDILAAHGVVDCAPYLSDWTETAALVSALDLVVTVDTAVLHVAGGLGKLTFVLLPFVPDWRWQLERSDSPWYPTVKLFRQPASGDWEPAVASVRAELERMANSVNEK